MEGYTEALGCFDDHFSQAQLEGYKWGWTNCLTVMKVDRNNRLWY